MKSSKKFAVFDIDGTLIRWQLYHAVVNELAKGGHLGKGAIEKIHNSRMVWKRRSHEESFKDYEDVLRHTYTDALQSLSQSQHDEAIEKIFQQYKDQGFTYTRDLIRKLRAGNYLLLAISGSQQDIVNKLADYYGFDDAVGATFEPKGSNFTGEVKTPVENKGAVLKQLAAKHDLTFRDSFAVGDSASDSAMLELVDNPIAFNPDKSLFRIANAKNWKVVVERKNMIYELEKSDGKYLLV